MSAYTFEIWKDIEGYENEYQISTFGRVKSLARKIISKDNVIYRTTKEIIRKPIVSKRGYYTLGLRRDGTKNIHRLLAKTFIPNPLNKKCINHIDGNKLNNNLGNLEWVTHEENMAHAFRTGLTNNSGERNGRAKLKESQVKQIREEFNGKNRRELANKFGVCYDTIHYITHYDNWKL